MAKAAPQITTFDAGELSPLMGGRVDFTKFPNGCLTFENFICTVQGPAIRRGGARFVKPIKNAASQSWLVPFIVSDGIAYMIEFGAGYMRFFANRGQLIDGSGNPVEVATPYTQADLVSEDGTFAFRFAQSADVMYIFHGSYPTKKLQRTTATSFSLVNAVFVSGPFQDVNTNTGITVQASAQTGGVSLTASAAIFTAANIGQLFYLEQRDNSAVSPWGVHEQVSVNDLRRVDSRTYLCVAVGATAPQVTGNETPTHTQGDRADGDFVDIADDSLGSVGAMWRYQHSGYATVLITGVSDGQHATGTVTTNDPTDQTVIPQQIVSSGTYKWAHPLYNSTDGFPQNGTFWSNRLATMRDRWLALSVSADFENFASKDADEQTDDSAVVEQLNARQLNKLAWMVEADSLLVGMTGDEWVISASNSNAALSSTNIQARRRTSYGSKRLQPVQIGGTLLFVQKSGRKLRDYQYNFTTDNYVSTDTTKLSSHVTKGVSGTNNGLMSICYQQEPYSIVWAARADGQLIGITYDREESDTAVRSDVYGWHRHPMTNAFVECVASMPSPEGDQDDLWMIVRRTINGQTVRYVEYLNQTIDYEDVNADDQNDAFYVDCGITYEGAPTMSVGNLSHLEGQQVAILGDGAVHPSQTVTGGAVPLEIPASTVQVGIPTTCRIQTMQLNAGAADGTSQGKTKRITNMVTRFLRSLGGVVGPSFNATDLETLNFRKPSNAMDTAVPLFTGDIESNWRGGYEDASFICYQNDQPLPVAILGFYPIVQTSDDR